MTSIPRPTCGLRILNRRDERWWSVTICAVLSASRSGTEFFQSVETHGDGWSGGGSFDLVHWPPRYAVGVLPPDGPIVHVRDGVTSPAHGGSVLQSLRFRRAEAFSGDKNAATHWQHIDDVIALLGGGAPYAQSWDTHRVGRLRDALALAMATASVVDGDPWK